jgi:hypothetical protein
VDWAAGGPEAIARVRQTDPSTYMRVVASILPKDVLVNVQQQTWGYLDPEAWGALRRLPDLNSASGVDGDPQSVFAMIEEDSRARLLVPVDAK